MNASTSPAGPDNPPAGNHEDGALTAAGTLREWRDLRPDERDLEWDDLVAWVIWLNDWYGLGGTGGLPGCWPEHAGLAEELRTLKAWREQLYDGAAEAGQGAAYWHDHLRRVLAAANTMYAPSCNAGHRIQGKTVSPETRKKWAAADPASRTPGTISSHQLPAALTGPQMASLIASGRARPAGRARHLAQAAWYRDHWWQHQDGQWQRITNPAMAAEFARLAAMNEQADAAAEQVPRDPHPGSPGPDQGPQPVNGA